MDVTVDTKKLVVGDTLTIAGVVYVARLDASGVVTFGDLPEWVKVV